MSSFYSDASLVMIPSGYKASKVYSAVPTDGAGDLVFTRALDTATRVGPDGLIEKVRTNAILHSNGFSNVVWDNIGTTETSGQAGFDGTNNAWFLTEDSSTGNHLIRQFPSVYGLTTLSIYAKAGTRNFVYLRGVQSSANVIGWFNLSTGTVGTVQANGTGKIENVGGGWYRCSLTVANFQSPFELYVGLSNADNVTSYTGNGTGNILIQNFQYETGDIATPYIPTTTAAVSVGMLANVPRLDYTGGGCPKLLLEPQRTNLVTFSEQFNNAAWAKVSSSITANATISPDGNTTADLLTSDNIGSFGRIQQTLSASGIITFSLFVKQNTANLVTLFLTGTGIGLELGTSLVYDFNFTTNTLIKNISSSSTATTIKVENFENNWKRISVTVSSTTITDARIYSNWATINNFSTFIYGCQLEAGSFPTSYIPTLAAAVTRSADAASKTGISALIGQTEGTLFVDAILTKDPTLGFVLQVSDGTQNNRVQITLDNSLAYQITGSNLLGANGTFSFTNNTRLKMAFAYKSGDSAFFINGVKVTTTAESSLNVPTALSRVDIGRNHTSAFPISDQVNQTLIFKTRLTNAQCIELTA